MSNREIHENLSHLTLSEIDEVIGLYEEGVKVYEIADLYNIKLQHGSLAPLLPPKILSELCPYCGVPLFKKVSRLNSSIYCPVCLHQPTKSCTCDNCTKAGEDSRKTVRELVLSLQSTPVQPTSLIQWLYLKTLFNAGHIGDGVIKPLNEMGVKLTPGNPILNDIMIAKSLYENRVVQISDRSSIYGFPREDECDTPSFYIPKVCFRSNIDMQLPDYDEQELEELYKLIAASEVLEYIEYQVGKVSQKFSYSDVIRERVYSLLDNFSTSQIFSIVWSSVNYSVRCHSEGWLKRKNFTTHLLKSCNRYGQRAITEGWTVKSFERCKFLPQSLVSQLLDGMLGKSGF
jgi:hypothetical protein